MSTAINMSDFALTPDQVKTLDKKVIDKYYSKSVFKDNPVRQAYNEYKKEGIGPMVTFGEYSTIFNKWYNIFSLKN